MVFEYIYYIHITYVVDLRVYSTLYRVYCLYRILKYIDLNYPSMAPTIKNAWPRWLLAFTCIVISSMCLIDEVEARQFDIPVLGANQWNDINHDLASALAPLHFDLSNDLISPKVGGELFTDTLVEFLKSIPDISCRKSKTYQAHSPKTLANAKKLKNTLRKKAFSPSGTDEDRKAFHDAIKTVSYLKKMERKKNKEKQTEFEEKQFLNNFWSFAKRCAEGRISTDPARPTFGEAAANKYYPNKYSVASHIDTTNLNWFPYIDADRAFTFDMSPIRPRDIKHMLKKKKPNSPPGDDGVL